MGLEFLTNLASDFNPLKWAADEYRRGQDRDEARSVRAGDIERDQKNFERNTLTGRVTEGANLGLSKLASIGAQPNNSMTATVGQAQPNIGGHEVNTNSRLERELLNSQIEGVRLDNLKKAQDLRKPVPGTPDQGGFMPGTSRSKHGVLVVEKPMERTKTYPGKPHMEPGAVAGSGFEVTPTGLAPIPGGDVKERIEDSPYETRNYYRYGFLPNFGDRSSAPPRDENMKKKDLVWAWSAKAQEWQQMPMIEAAERDEYSWLDRQFRKLINWKGD